MLIYFLSELIFHQKLCNYCIPNSIATSSMVLNIHMCSFCTIIIVLNYVFFFKILTLDSKFHAHFIIIRAIFFLQIPFLKTQFLFFKWVFERTHFTKIYLKTSFSKIRSGVLSGVLIGIKFSLLINRKW